MLQSACPLYNFTEEGVLFDEDAVFDWLSQWPDDALDALEAVLERIRLQRSVLASEVDLSPVAQG